MNELKRVAEFREVLDNYHLSSSAEQVLAGTPLVLLVGPSGGGGRNTIIRELLKTGKYHNIVSDTTRKMRFKNGEPIEQNGREYWFRTEEDVLNDLRQGEFLEAAIIHEQQVSGISIREVARARQDHHIAITDVETAGADTVHALKPDSLIFFIIPPTFEEWMHRLRNRGDLPEAELRRRLKSACREFETMLARDFYIPIVNDQLDQAVAAIHATATTGKRDPAKERQANLVTGRLLQAARSYLHNEHQAVITTR